MGEMFLLMKGIGKSSVSSIGQARAYLKSERKRYRETFACLIGHRFSWQ